MSRANEVTERPERSPIQVLDHLRCSFAEIRQRKIATGESEESIIRNWFSGVRIGLSLLKDEELIPGGLEQETDEFLKACLSPEFKPTIEGVYRTYRLIDKVSGRKPTGNQ